LKQQSLKKAKSVDLPPSMRVKTNKGFQIWPKLYSGRTWGASAKNEENEGEDEHNETNINGFVKFCEHGFLLLSVSF
jgi:hypothetical protein